MRLLLILLLFLTTATSSSFAEQLNFSKQSVSGVTGFYYKWQGMQGQVEELSFKLPTESIDQSLQSFKIFDNRRSNDYVYEKMKEYAQANSDKMADIKVKRVRLGFELEAKGKSREKINEVIAGLKEVQQKAMDEYVKSHYYSYISDSKIKPDHARIAKAYVAPMRPVAQAIADKVGNNDYREVTNFTLSFLQAVPYDFLRSRWTSNGAGFQMPYAFLATNKGDCDTKSVVLASILRNFYPRLRMVMVYTPGHAFIGLAIPVKKGDMALQIKGTTFVLAEPVGPHQAPIGIVAEKSKAKLIANDYAYEEIPF